jgi:hypothetical protein
MNPHIPTDTEIETSTGTYVNLEDPDPNTISLENISHALAHFPRFGGHARQFYSVAAHSCWVARLVERTSKCPVRALAGLHHDSTEAFLTDIPRPLKASLGPNYARLTKRMDAAIIEALELPLRVEDFHAEDIKLADNAALWTEARALLPSRGEKWGLKQTFNLAMNDPGDHAPGMRLRWAMQTHARDFRTLHGRLLTAARAKLDR